MNNFWNERYSTKEYAYGEKPNRFFKEEISKLKQGSILFPAEGEGRNAVYAATLGWQVKAFDTSTEGREKALQLAEKHKVKIDYRIESYEQISFRPESFDCIVLIFAHMPAAIRQKNHQQLLEFLKPGGTIILEGFSKEQINHKSGGPRDREMLFSAEELRNDFRDLSSLRMEETDTLLDEGPFHQGLASVIRLIGRK
ncbi:class I SAM-dependent methyltransferase [Maribellus sp. CM-23]|uniref:class I SAM-dependent methyltransferase n=1 Tax=Maribellus sp. CM-23 TaxID=2781026 RepID=UPI001F353435|nr:class I SAM-dependent methyltransferase [Maribellus sp. CM-23]MCE4565237.1 class I SAM-dependent methyltransferase [Maribellus sp. CM-23]